MSDELVLPEFDKTHVLVVGDVMLDRYILGDVQRISPEAPVPVVRVRENRYNPGGAANVAMNVAKLGANVTLFGMCGNDREGEILKDLLIDNGIRNYLLRTTVPTTVKARVVSKNHQMIRLDTEEYYELTEEKSAEAIKYVLNLFANLQLVVISDYGKGMAGEKFCKRLIETCTEKNLPVIVDPKGRNWIKYKGAQLITPNLKELSEVFNKEIPNEDAEVEAFGKLFLEKTSFPALLVTRSDKGMSLISEEGCMHLNALAREVFDVSGAGDTVIATIGCMLAAGMPLPEAVTMANIAAGIAVCKTGTAPVTRGELLHLLEQA